MHKTRRQISVSTMESLFRDLHVVITLLHAEPDDERLIKRYLDTNDLIWEAITGEPSLCYCRPNVYCKPISDREVEDARGS